jgi:hypothetical protein
MRWFLLVAIAALAGCDNKDDAAIYLPKAGPTGFVDVTADTWKGVATLTCKPARVEACGRDGCKEGKPLVEVRWEPSGSYQRCDAKGCDSYQPKVSYSGIWTNISIPESGMMARIAADGQFLEVATLNDFALVYHGQCDKVSAR